MRDVVEVICELRRTLDREAGSDIASRRARMRFERLIPIRERAAQLFDARKWKSVRHGALAISGQVIKFAQESDIHLSADRAEITIYEWLLAHAKHKPA